MRKLLFGLLAVALAGGVLVAQAPKPADPVKPADPAKPADPKPADPAKPADTKPADAPKGVTSDLYPLTKGSKWTYAMGNTDVIVKVTDVDKDGAATLVTEHQNKQVASETILVKADGIYRTKINNNAISDGGVKILALKDGKPTKGEKWPVKVKVGTSEVSGEFETKEVAQAVKIGATDYKDVVYVEGPKFTIAGTETAVKLWLAPTKGVVKLGYTIGGTESTPLELKSYEAGK